MNHELYSYWLRQMQIHNNGIYFVVRNAKTDFKLEKLIDSL